MISEKAVKVIVIIKSEIITSSKVNPLIKFLKDNRGAI